jgi:penicillin G amidase
MQRALRIIGIIAAVLIVLALILGGVWLGFSRRAYPKTTGTIEIEGISNPVEAYRDEFGVPHIYAQTPEDLFFAQGYVHAQDRFWQMEFWRRIGAGRLSELFGETSLSSDIFLRTMGFTKLAEQEYAQMDDDSRAIAQAYADGVNAYVSSRKPEELGLEFALLQIQGVDIEIEPWTPVNSLTWAKIMSYDLGGNMDDELIRVQMIRAVGLDMAADYYPAFRDDFPVIVPDEELDKLALPETAHGNDYAAKLMALNPQFIDGFDPSSSLAFGSGAGIGSNNWVISGDLTDTGMPLLANDPHLSIQMPSIWYEVGLHCVNDQGEVGRTDSCPYEVRGYSFAGVPGVIIGHNDRIAWGFTNVGPDTQDLYIERINPENPNQYEVNGEWVDMELRSEEIRIEGQDEPYVLHVRSTRHGPLITDNTYADEAGFSVGDDGIGYTALSLHWTALQQNNTFRSVWLLNRAENWDDFREALSYFDTPSQNIVYADVDGNIGYQMPGLIPIRAKGDGSLPVPGWTDDYEWTGFIPYDELPRAFNPEQGYIATANQPVVSENYPYLITVDFDRGYRAKRINQMILTDTDGISIEDIQAMQGDNLSLSALEVLPYLEDIRIEEPAQNAARDRLLNWDAQMHMDSPDAALYALFWMELVHKTFNDQLPQDLWPGGGAPSQDALYWLLQEEDNPWWDDITTPDTVETRDDILARAWSQGYSAGVETFGSNLDEWRWGALHTATFENATLGRSGIDLIESIFNRGPVAASGGSGMVNATNWSGTNPFDVSSVPSMRQIIDMGDLSNSLMVHTTGQSGHPGHKHYDDFIDPWRLIQFHSTLWLREAVEANAREHLTLKPAQ